MFYWAQLIAAALLGWVRWRRVGEDVGGRMDFFDVVAVAGREGGRSAW